VPHTWSLRFSNHLLISVFIHTIALLIAQAGHSYSVRKWVTCLGQENKAMCFAPRARVRPPAPPSPESTRFCFHYLIFICPIMKQGRGQILKGPTTRRTGMTNFQISGETPCLVALYKPSVTPVVGVGERKPCCSKKIITLSVHLVSTGKQNSLIRLFTLC